MFAVVKDNSVIGFLMDQAQQSAYDNTYTFYEFEWSSQVPPDNRNFTVASGVLRIAEPVTAFSEVVQPATFIQPQEPSQ